jgi:predicted  nucleic acid-binding Zn-ribbon protein
MAWKIFNIGKANDEITRLESELAARDKRIAELETEKKALGENDNAVATAATQQRAELDAANARIAVLEREKTELTGKITQLEDDVVTAKASASKKALEITAGQGQPPLPQAAGGPGVGTGDIIAQHAALLAKDPQAAMEFYQKNKVAYDSAWKAANRPK